MTGLTNDHQISGWRGNLSTGVLKKKGIPALQDPLFKLRSILKTYFLVCFSDGGLCVEPVAFCLIALVSAFLVFLPGIPSISIL